MKINDPIQIDFSEHLPLEVRENLKHPVMLLAWLAELNPDAIQWPLSDENRRTGVATVSS